MAADSEASGNTSRSPPVYWPDAAVVTLLDVWGEMYTRFNRGILGRRHWEDVVQAFNQKTGKGFEQKHLKAKLDSLKKKYKTENARVVETVGGQPSEWTWYERCDGLWGCTSKVAEMPGAMDNEEHMAYTGRAAELGDSVPTNLTEDSELVSPSVDTVLEPEVDATPLEIEATPPVGLVESPHTHACNIPSVVGKPIAKRKKKSAFGAGSFGRPIAKFLMAFVETYKGLEETKIQMAKDQMVLVQAMHADRQALEMRMHADRQAMEERHIRRGEDLKIQLAQMKLEFSGSKRKVPEE